MLRLLIIIMACLGLSACGVKPGHIDAPAGSSYKFPQPYPDPQEINK